MATTTNYSWTTPDDTDLVKDGAAAIRTLGSSADTTVKNLNPGTTAGDIDYYTSGTAKARVAIGTANQVLQVNSGGTAPEWGVDPVADIITTAGDLIYGTAADTVARLGIGTAGQVLKVNSGATAPEWGVAASGPTGWTLLNTGGTALTGATTITVSGLSAKEILVLVIGASSVNASSNMDLRINGDSAANYTFAGLSLIAASTYSTSFLEGEGAFSTRTNFSLGRLGNNEDAELFASARIDLADTTNFKSATILASGTRGSGNGQVGKLYQGIYEASAAVTSISIISSSGNFDAGTVYVMGAN